MTFQTFAASNTIELESCPRCGSERSQAMRDEQTLGQFIPLIYHYNMLQDEDRVGAFRDAIELVVEPEMHVVELGGGTGILSSLAARRGARVTCVERNPELVQSARKFIRANGLADSITVIQADALNFAPSSRVDVVICEMLHVGLLREKQAQVISAFKRNYVQRFGATLPIFLPEASVLMVQPVEQSFEFAGYHAPVPMFQAPLLDQPRTRPLAALSPYANIAYGDTIPTRYDVTQSIEIAADGHLNALRFVTQNVITVDEMNQRAVTWPNQCLVLPLDEPVKVTEGQKVSIDFAYDAGGSIDSLASSLRLAVEGRGKTLAFGKSQ